MMRRQLDQRILVLDGAMGTMIQRLGLDESAFKGELFKHHDVDIKGNNDILCLTCSDAILDIHRQYIAAGADIISTNSFNANRISQADYKLERYVAEINLAAARLARQAAEEAAVKGRKVWVAGSVGPTNRSASMSPTIDDPSARNVTYDQLFAAYSEQIEALIAGGCDVILMETVFDTLNLKAGLAAANELSKRLERKIDVMVSASVADKSGRILSGQTIEALWHTISDFDCIISLGLNCSWGSAEMLPFIKETSEVADGDVYVSCHPNAGLPDEQGRYVETPEQFADNMSAIMSTDAVNIVGGCCGTTPEHIAALKACVSGYKPRQKKPKLHNLWATGLDAFAFTPDKNFVNIGERCNVAGSRKFLRLIKEGSYAEAVDIARKQIEDGAQLLDINMDDAMIDAAQCMTTFVRLLASEPDIARVPLMIDSSQWAVVEAGLKATQGKCIVNSISLKEGEAAFLAKARFIRNLSAAVVVMAFDEQGQADTFERRIEICSRAYSLLVKDADFNPCDIIFDPNIMAVATGIPEHDGYAKAYIEALKWIKTNLPHAYTSGGVSNLSFAFRGHNALRESMHAIFLYHAIEAGLDMAIVNPSMTMTYDDVAPDLRDIISSLVVTGNHESAEALAEYAETAANERNSVANNPKKEQVERSQTPVGERLVEAVVKGNTEHLDADIDEALTMFDNPIDIIEKPLMEGLNRVGTLFGQGKMFLPQVVKAARVMKLAVDRLKPSIEISKSQAEVKPAGTILFATVKGDVHDIGKNIVSIVLECNNYRVIDLGVMVPAEEIVAVAKRERPDIICLSGLITPSLAEMVNVADCLEKAGLDIPLIVGGATTSKVHTALKVDPHLSAPVVHASDASQNPIIAAQLLNEQISQSYISSIEAEYERIRKQAAEKAGAEELLPIGTARAKALHINWNEYDVPVPNKPGITRLDEISIADVAPLINWPQLLHAWRMIGKHGVDSNKEADKLLEDARALLDRLSDMPAGRVIKAAVGIFEASSFEDNVIIYGESAVTLPMLRQQIVGQNGFCNSLSDLVKPQRALGNDYIGVFAITASGQEVEVMLSELKANKDEYNYLLLRTLLDRIAEASSEYLHWLVRTDIWGYSPDEEFDPQRLKEGQYKGIRPAIGYPMLPEQALNHDVAALLPMKQLGIEITENGAMNPPASVCGLYIAHPQARYFMVGRIGDDQLADYAAQRHIDIVEMRRRLIHNL